MTYFLKGPHLQPLQDLLSVLLKDVQVRWSFGHVRVMVVVLRVMPEPSGVLALLGDSLLRRPGGRTR